MMNYIQINKEDSYFDGHRAMRRLCYYRMTHGLPCAFGKLSIEDLRDEQCKRDVAAFFVSMTEKKILLDTVHFGVIDHPQYQLIRCIVMQKEYDFKVLNVYTISGDNMYVDKEKQLISGVVLPTLQVEAQVLIASTMLFDEYRYDTKFWYVGEREVGQLYFPFPIVKPVEYDLDTQDVEIEVDDKVVVVETSQTILSSVGERIVLPIECPVVQEVGNRIEAMLDSVEYDISGGTDLSGRCQGEEDPDTPLLINVTGEIVFVKIRAIVVVLRKYRVFTPDAEIASISDPFPGYSFEMKRDIFKNTYMRMLRTLVKEMEKLDSTVVLDYNLRMIKNAVWADRKSVV
jgi:hypothetical protein